MKDEKKVKATEEEAKKEENGVQLTDEELSSVTGGIIKVTANLVDAASGAAVEEIPLEGANVKVKAMETLGGPYEFFQF